MKIPAVTLVIPSYNSSHFLNWTLESVANQTLENFECIVVDDCSTDTSILDAKNYFKDPRFRLIRHKANLGLSGARNTGLRAAKGRYVAFLDSDDLLMENSLQVRVATCLWGARNSSRFVGSYCGSDQIEEDLMTAPASREINLPFIDFLSSNGLCPFNANQPMLRRDVLRQSGGFNQELTQAEDFDLWQRIMRAGYIFAPARHVSVTYRKRTNSMIRRAPITHLKTSLDLINSSTQSLRDDQIAWGPNRYEKPLHHYVAQERKVDRVLQFSGMNLASPDPETVENLARLASAELPDLQTLETPTKSLKSIIRKGIKRQLGRDAPELEPQLEKLYEQISIKPQPTYHAEDACDGVYTEAPKNRVWFARDHKKYDIIFIPQSGYHVWTISLIGAVLAEAGVDYITLDVSPEWRDGGVRAAAEKFGLDLIGVSEFTLGQYRPKSIITFNDWDPVIRPILIAAKAAGLRTVSIVEGIQDYDDADVHWERFAYKTTDIVLLPGEFDRKYFKNHNAIVDVVGIPRVHELRTAPAPLRRHKKKQKVLINSNFSYGVLVEHRDQWLKEAVESVLANEMVPVISRHPADVGTLYSKYVTKNTFYEALEDCEMTIQRFASGVLEALARQKGVIYYNPHNEQVDKFTQDPMNAYLVANNSSALHSALQNAKEVNEMARLNGQAFLDHHAGKISEDAVQLCAEKVIQYLSDTPSDEVFSEFKNLMEAVDWRTNALFTVRENNQPVFPDPLLAESQVRQIKDRMDNMTAHVIQPILRDVSSFKKPHVDQKFKVSEPSQKEALILSSQLVTELLLAPKDTLNQIRKNGRYQESAKAAGQAASPEAEHFRKVLDWAKRKVG